MKYNFSEKNLGQNFCHETVEQIKTAIQKGASSTIIGMPLVGMITFSRYLVTKNFAYFIYIDAQSLKHKTQSDLFLSLYNELEGDDMQAASVNAFEACKKQLRELRLIHERIVILVVRLDYLTEELSTGLLADFKTLADIGVGKIIFMGTSRLPLYQTSTNAVSQNPSFMIDPIYFTPFEENDLKQIPPFLPGVTNSSPKTITNIFILSGGHISLLWQLLKTDHLDNPLNDDIIKIHLQTIYDAYSSIQQSQLRRIAAGKPVKALDPFLLKIGLAKEVDGRYELFTPLLRDYILQYTQTKMSKKEKKLFALLKKKKGKMVTKEEIFEAIWLDDDNVSEASLTSLLYRLRKNQSIINQGYVIENEKGEGYRMVKKS